MHKYSLEELNIKKILKQNSVFSLLDDITRLNPTTDSFPDLLHYRKILGYFRVMATILADNAYGFLMENSNKQQPLLSQFNIIVPPFVINW